LGAQGGQHPELKEDHVMRSKPDHVKDLLLQALETEIGGQRIYELALECVSNPDLQAEWEEYLTQTRNHEEVVRGLLVDMGIDADEMTPGRAVVRHLGKALVEAMRLALETGEEQMIEVVAAECVILAETKDHQNWELIGELAKKAEHEHRRILERAHEEVEDEEDEHLYHSQGWARELWIDALGMRAVFPPPEERKDVKTAIGAARAHQARSSMQ
jgi:rubrerythrin